MRSNLVASSKILVAMATKMVATWRVGVPANVLSRGVGVGGRGGNNLSHLMLQIAQGDIVKKPVRTNAGLKADQGFDFSCIK